MVYFALVLENLTNVEGAASRGKKSFYGYDIT